MLPRSFQTHLLTTSQWLLVMIPLSCALSRFVSDVLLSLVAVFFLVHVVTTVRTDWLKARWVQVALVLWVYAVLLSVIAPNFETALGRSLSWLRFPMFAAACTFWLMPERRVRARLMVSLSITVAFMLLDTALQYFTGTDLLGWPTIPSNGSDRLTGPFSSPRVGIVLVWISVPVVSYWLMNEGGGTRKGRALWAGIAYAIGLLTVVFMSGERMALLLTGLGFLLAFFLLPISKRLMLAIGLMGALLMGALAYTNPGLVVRQMDSTSHVVSDFEASDYGMIWSSAFAIAREHPIFGVGLRQFREACPDPRYGSLEHLEKRCNQHPHNMYLEWLTESGGIGLGLFVLMVVLMVQQVVRTFPTLRKDPIFLGLVITLFIRLWPLASNTSFFTAWSAVPMWLVMGWLLAMCHRPKP